MKFGWESEKSKIGRRAKVLPYQKLESIRSMNEMADKVLTKRQKLNRAQLRLSE